MANSPADILAEFLVFRGHATRPAANGLWTIYVDNMPTERDQAICIYNTDGVKQGRGMRSQQTWERPGIQVRVRGLDKSTPRAKMESLRAFFDTLAKETIIVGGNAYTLWCISRVGGILYMGQEETKLRENYTSNFLLSLD